MPFCPGRTGHCAGYSSALTEYGMLIGNDLLRIYVSPDLAASRDQDVESQTATTPRGNQW